MSVDAKQAFEATMEADGYGGRFVMNAGTNKTFTLQVPALTILTAMFVRRGTGYASFNIVIKDANGPLLTETYASAGRPYGVFVEKGGSYTIEFTNRSGTTNQEVDLSIEFRKVISIGANKKIGDKLSYDEKSSLKKGDLRYYYFNTSENAEITGTMKGSGTGKEDIDTALLTLKFANEFSIETAGEAIITKKFVKAGSYIFEVSFDSDLPKGFKIDLSLNPPPASEKEPNNTNANATVFKIGGKVLAELKGKDVDVFKFSLINNLKSDEVLILKFDRPNSYSNYKCSLEDSFGTKIYEKNHNRYGCFIVAGKLKAGDYYARIEFDSTTSLSYKYELKSEIVKGNFEDEPNNDAGTATVITSATAPIYGDLRCDIKPPTGTSTSCSKADVSKDYYEFTMPKLAAGAKLFINSEKFGSYISTSTTYKTKLDIVDSNGKVLASGYLGDRLVIDNTKVPAGNYFIKLEYDFSTFYMYYSWWYKISFSQGQLTTITDGDIQKPAKPNNTAATAQDLGTKFPVMIIGELPHSPKDYDYYKLTLAADMKAGQTLSISLRPRGSRQNTCSIGFDFMDANDKVIDDKSGCTVYPRTLDKTGLKKGTYYIRVNRTSTSSFYYGDHSVDISFK